MFLIAIGLVIIIFTLFDFFHTTLSGKGYWYISAKVNTILSRIILSNKSRFFFDYSGLIHVLTTAFTWLALLVLGTFIVFISQETMVIDFETGRPANLIERFYFTCYVLSTLGVGDFIPGNEISKVLTGILSFTGFVLLTTGLTYLLSVVNSVLDKKELSLTISTLGEDLVDLYKYFEMEDGDRISKNSDSLRRAILKNSSNFLAFPIINHFMTRHRDRAAEVQLASLYEVLNVLKSEFAKETVAHTEILTILNAVESYLQLGLEDEEDFDYDPHRLEEVRLFWPLRGKEYNNNPWKDRSINAALKSAGWSWQDVYHISEKNK